MIARTTSPFTQDDFQQNSWIVWQRVDSVVSLDEREKLRERGLDFNETSDNPVRGAANYFLPPNSVQLKRNQYHSVLNQIHQATRRAGSYSEWTPLNT